METPASQITCSNEDVNSALIALARLLGRQAAKELVEAGGKAVKEQVSKDEADDVKAKLEAVGAEIEVK